MEICRSTHLERTEYGLIVRTTALYPLPDTRHVTFGHEEIPESPNAPQATEGKRGGALVTPQTLSTHVDRVGPDEDMETIADLEHVVEDRQLGPQYECT